MNKQDNTILKLRDRNEYLESLLKKAAHYVEFSPGASELREKIKKALEHAQYSWGRHGWTFVDDQEVENILKKLGFTEGDMRCKIMYLIEAYRTSDNGKAMQELREKTDRLGKRNDELNETIQKLKKDVDETNHALTEQYNVHIKQARRIKELNDEKQELENKLVQVQQAKHTYSYWTDDVIKEVQDALYFSGIDSEGKLTYEQKVKALVAVYKKSKDEIDSYRRDRNRVVERAVKIESDVKQVKEERAALQAKIKELEDNLTLADQQCCLLEVQRSNALVSRDDWKREYEKLRKDYDEFLKKYDQLSFGKNTSDWSREELQELEAHLDGIGLNGSYLTRVAKLVQIFKRVNKLKEDLQVLNNLL